MMRLDMRCHMNPPNSSQHIPSRRFIADLAAGAACLFRQPLPFAVLLLIACSLKLVAQGSTGTLTGTVSDPSRARIAGAAVSVRNTASGDIRLAVTNKDGYFTVAAIATGTYDVSISAKGFKQFDETGIVFNSEDKRNVDAILQVGDDKQVVTVTAESQVITLDTGEQSSVLSQTELQNFTQVGRSAAEFLKILPGVAQAGNGAINAPAFSGEVMGVNGSGEGTRQSALGFYAVNGTPPQTIQITADSANVSDPGCNCGSPVNPNPDMLQEFKVLAANFSADNSKGPIVISSLTKAGSSDYHGEAYFSIRNYALNANPWINNAFGVSRPQNTFAYPGGNIGGPIRFPGSSFNVNRDKAFFFVGYEYYYQKLDSGLATASVPTANMRGGNFTAAEIANLGPAGKVPGDPTPIKTTGIPGTLGGVRGPGYIDPAYFDPGGVALINLYPLPNANPLAGGATAGFNYVGDEYYNQNSYQFVTRLDYSLSDRTKIFGRYNLQNELQVFPFQVFTRSDITDQVPYPSMVESPNQSQSLSVDLIHVLSASMTNEFVGAYTYINSNKTFQNPAAVEPSTIGYPYKGPFGKTDPQLPNLVSAGAGASANQIARILNIAGFEVEGGDWRTKDNIYSLADNVTKVLASHTLKGGVFYELVHYNQPTSLAANATNTYAGTNSNSSGNAYADMLLGYTSGFTQTNLNGRQNQEYRDAEGYLDDTWKATSHLTLEIGLRLQHLGQFLDVDGKGLGVWLPNTYVATPVAASNFAPGIQWHSRDPAVPISGKPTRALFYSPRFSMAWDVFGNGRTTLRGGWGMFRYHIPANTQDGVLIPQGGFTYSTNGAFVSSCDIDQANTIAANGTATGCPDPLYKAPAGSLPGTGQGVYEQSTTALDPNNSEEPMTYSYSFSLDREVLHGATLQASYVGTQSLHQYEDVFHNVNAVPQGTFTGSSPTTAAYNAKRPLAYYADLQLGVPDNYLNYNSLQVVFNKRSKRWTYLINYTYSKSLGVVATNDNELNQRANYGPLANDRRHAFNATYSVRLGDPIHMNRLLAGAVNGWQVSGVTQVQSGVNLQQSVGGGNFSLGVPSGSNLNASFVNGTNSIQVMPLITAGCDPRSHLGPHQYVNVACFGLPSAGTNGPIIEPETFGPWYFTDDLALFKTFAMRHERRLQFRASAFNFLNHPIYSFGQAGDTNLQLNFGTCTVVNPCTASAGQAAGATSGTGQTNHNFGIATNKIGNRLMELSVKYFF